MVTLMITVDKTSWVTVVDQTPGVILGQDDGGVQRMTSTGLQLSGFLRQGFRTMKVGGIGWLPVGVNRSGSGGTRGIFGVGS